MNIPDPEENSNTWFARRCFRDGIPALTRDFLAFPLAGRGFSPKNPPNF
jgi:hypothetical protein